MARAFNAHFEFGETHKKLLIKYPPDNNVEDTTSTPSNIFQLNALIKSYKMSIIIVRRKEVMICQCLIVIQDSIPAILDKCKS